MERSGGEDESDQLPEEAPPEQVVDDRPGEHDETGGTGDKDSDSDPGTATGNPANAG
jgi:hypothetical protein